jgi:Arc/MetJ-type ribon-helix-helix transcriptional regulator
MVSRTVSFELEDLNKIQKKIENGEVDNLSEFVQKAINNELNR